MSGSRIILGLSLLGGFSSLACGDKDERPPGSASDQGAAGGMGGMGSEESSGGVGGALEGETSTGGGGYQPPEPACGNGSWDPQEICDASAGGFESCQDFGFDLGVTICDQWCNLKIEGCYDDDGSGRPQNICGDGHVDTEEECEDGNALPGDGCSESCLVEGSESEPNGSDTTANVIQPGHAFYGELTNGDHDWTRFVIEDDGSTLTASVEDLLPYGCRDEAPGVNPALELIDAEGDPIAWDSDSGPGACPQLEVYPLSAGTYYLRVVAEMSGEFPYVLRSSL